MVLLAIFCCILLYFAILCYTLLVKGDWSNFDRKWFDLQYFAIFCYILLYSVIFCYTLLYLAILCYTLLYLAISCYTLVYLAILCHTWLYLAIHGYHLQYFAILCFTLLYFAISYYILLYFAIIWGLNPPHIIFTWIQAKFLISDFPILISDFPFDIRLPFDVGLAPRHRSITRILAIKKYVYILYTFSKTYLVLSHQHCYHSPGSRQQLALYVYLKNREKNR